MKESVLVGISGGIDSAMAVILLKNQGYNVHGVYFNFHTDDKYIDTEKEKIANLAKKLNIPHSYYDVRKLFQNEVINYFTSFYTKGLTPSPCVYCNAHVKLKLLSDLASEWGHDYFATGHYIRLFHENGMRKVRKGKDEKKDQSYYMWMVPQNILQNFLVPLGELNKNDIKEIAVKSGFSELVHKKESTGLCFAKGKSIAALLQEYAPELVNTIGKGKVYDKLGNEVGTHQGYIYYTLGQKSNLNLDIEGKPAVVKIDHRKNALTIDHWNSLYSNSFIINDAVFYEPNEIEGQTEITTKVRGLGLNPNGKTKLTHLEKNKYQVILENPAWAAAPGQPVIFYQNDKVLGGGIIHRQSNSLKEKIATKGMLNFS